jgi:hypothetical protein
MIRFATHREGNESRTDDVSAGYLDDASALF